MKIFFLMVFLLISSCSFFTNIARDRSRLRDITNNRRLLYLQNYGQLDTYRELRDLEFDYEEDEK